MPEVLFVAANCRYSHTALGIWSLHAACREVGIDSSVCESTINEPEEAVLEQVLAAGAPVVGLSCHIWNIRRMLRLARGIRLVSPDTVIVLGGPEVSFGCTKEELSVCDAVSVGEGEQAWPGFLMKNRGKGRGGIKGVPGIIMSEDMQPEVVYPFSCADFGDPYTEEYFMATSGRCSYYESTRGCPFSCAFCLSPAMGKVRKRPLEEVFAHLDRFVTAETGTVKFVDRTFNADPMRARAIWQWMLSQYRSGRKMPLFQCEIAADLLTDEDIALLAMFPEGLLQLEAGMQTTCDETLRRIGRVTQTEKVLRRTRQLAEAGNIHIHLDLIAGLPGESAERFIQSVEEALGARPHMLQLGFLKLLRGSRLRLEAETLGLMAHPDAPYRILRTPDLSWEDMVRLGRMEEAMERFGNTGRWQKSLDFLMTDETRAGFWMSFSGYLHDKGWLSRPLGVRDMMMAMYAYGIDKACDATRLRALLRMDFLSSEPQAVLPDFLRIPVTTEQKRQVEQLLREDTLRQAWFPALEHLQGRDWLRHLVVMPYDESCQIWLIFDSTTRSGVWKKCRILQVRKDGFELWER